MPSITTASARAGTGLCTIDGAAVRFFDDRRDEMIMNNTTPTTSTPITAPTAMPAVTAGLSTVDETTAAAWALDALGDGVLLGSTAGDMAGVGEGEGSGDGRGGGDVDGVTPGTKLGVLEAERDFAGVFEIEMVGVLELERVGPMLAAGLGDTGRLGSSCSKRAVLFKLVRTNLASAVSAPVTAVI